MFRSYARSESENTSVSHVKVAILGDYPLAPNRITGGVEAVVSYLVAELKRFEDLDLHVVTLREDIQERHICRDGNLTVHYLPAAYRFANVTLFVVNKVRLLRELAAIKPDVIHAHIAGTYAEVAHMTGLPTVLTPHGICHRERVLEPGWLNRWMRAPLTARVEKASVRRARHLISISPYIQEEFGSLIRGTVYPIENPIAEKYFTLPDLGEPGRVLYAGYISRRKTVHHLIQAMALVRDRVPTACLRLAGAVDGESCWQIVQATVKDLNLEECVNFLGCLDEDHLFEEYERCEMLVLSSRQETAPMVIQQAMAAGKPVVATRVGGVPYLVHHEHTGLLVEYGDVDGLADAISLLLSNGSLRRRTGLAARAEAERRFRAADVARRTCQIYYAILGGGNNARHRWFR
jgi:glycosyltransferase involved in cell wall biosynthesis